MKLTKVHRILKFKQLDWLKTYTDFNTDKRKNASNSFEKEFFSKPTFVSQKIFSEYFVAIHETRPVLTLDKPIYVEFSILDLNKLLMYDFHYNYIKTKHDAKLLLTDTDSLVYEIECNSIETNDVYEDFYKDKDLFGFSDYPQDSEFFDLANKKVIGKMKDEFQGKIISGFVGLKSKMYSLIDADNEENKNSKRS